MNLRALIMDQTQVCKLLVEKFKRLNKSPGNSPTMDVVEEFFVTSYLSAKKYYNTLGVFIQEAGIDKQKIEEQFIG